MANAFSVNELVLRWQELRAQGRSALAEELCAGRPELLDDLKRQLEALASMEQFLGVTPGDLPVAGSAQTPPSASRPTARSAGSPDGGAGAPRVPGFEIIEELGRGGMGVVYKARQVALKRFVALKMILVGRHASAAELARFQVEAEAIARLQHPNIVQVHEVGTHDGLPYFSLEYCSAGSLERKLNGTPLSAPQAARLVETLARAMHVAHDKGVLHRDLKPGNVLLTEDGTPKITDFGLAKKLDEATPAKTTSGAVVGTPAYMAPEQADSRNKQIGPPCDIYALGAVLYECLTGRPPFRAATAMETLMQVMNDEPVPPGQLNSRVPRDVETICLKCLHKEPPRRYAAAADLADDLGRFLRGEPISARPVGRLERTMKWTRRNPVVAGLIAAVAVALLAIFTVVTVALVTISMAMEGEKNANTLAGQRLETVEQQKTEIQDALENKTKAQAVLQAQLSQAGLYYCKRSDLEVRRGNVADSLNWMLRAYETAKQAGDPLEQTYRRMIASQSPVLERTFVHDGAVSAVAFSPDGRRVLTGGEDKTARLWDAATGEPLGDLLRHDEGVNAVAFSPDGRSVLTGSFDKTARLWDAVSGQPLGQPLRHDGFVLAVAFSPDGRRVLTGSADKTARLWDAKTGQPVGQPLRHDGFVLAVAFSPDGRKVLTGSQDLTARLWDAATGQPVGAVLRLKNVVQAVAFRSNGTMFVTGSGDNTLQLWDAASRQALGQPFQHNAMVHAVAFSPDGRWLLSGSRDRTARLWGGGARSETFSHDDAVQAVAFSPDGRHVLTGSADKTARLWDVGNALSAGLPLRHEKFVVAGAFSRDGRRVLTGSVDQTARLWDADTGQLLCPPLHHDSTVWAVAFSPDGHSVLTGSADKTARLWDAATGRPLAEPLHHENIVWTVAFSPDGRRVLTGSLDQTARLWDAATGQPFGQPLRHAAPVRAVAFSPDSRRILTGSEDKTARLWDAATGQSLREPLRHEAVVLAVAFSPDGRQVLTGSADKTARLWDADTGQPLTAALHHLDLVLAVAFSLDGRRVATGSVDQTARLWDAASGQPLGEPLRHENTVCSLAFSPDGRSLLTGSWDYTARLWDIASGQPLGPPLRHGGMVHAVAFSPDGRRVLTASGDKTARLWERVESRAPDDPHHLRAWVHARTGKAFDAQGILRPLIRADWLQACKGLATNRSDWEAKSSGRRWHFIQAEETAAAKQWFAVEFHLRRLLADAPNAAEPIPTPQQLVELAKMLHKSNPDRTATLEFLGTALFRAGRHPEAIARLNEAIVQQKQRGNVLPELFLAMAHHQRGDTAKAREWLQQADARIKKRSDDNDAVPDQQERLREQQLRQEAADQLKLPPTAGPRAVP